MKKQERQVKQPRKPRLELKVARISAGYLTIQEFVDDLNKSLEKKGEAYRFNYTNYFRIEGGYLKEMRLEFAYFIATFLQIPISIFVSAKEREKFLSTRSKKYSEAGAYL